MSKEELVEIVAAMEHEQWASWVKTMAGRFGGIPAMAEYFNTRMVLAETPYGDLTEELKEHDRKWARLKVGAVMDYLLPKGAMK